jgi:iron(III) transport system permease protein
VLDDYLANTAGLIFGVGLLTASCGVATAWLVTMYRFPLSRVLEWALLLPLAVPAYVIAYVYTDLLEFAGPVQSALRGLFGWGPRDYWFPEIRSLEGAALMMALVLYPYVYMLARAAFLEQCQCVLEVSRTLGRGPWQTFVKVGLPLARPAVVAGLALVLMETVADYGTVQYFGVPTFTTGIYRAWFGLGEPTAAAQLSACLLGVVAALILLERWSRRGARFHHTSTRYRPLARRALRGPAALAATAACAAPVALGFLVPVAVLAWLTLGRGDQAIGARFAGLATNSFSLAAITAVLAVVLGTLLAYGARLAPTPATRSAARVAALGYAVPGSVIAVGILLPLAAFDNALDGLMRQTLGLSTGLLLTGTVAALVYGYLVRFLAISYNTIESSLGKVSPHMDDAARSLGRGPGGTLLHVHAPIIRGGALTAALLVFVDVMKELPATLILRPFNFDTLAVRVYQLASDERLAEASTAALTIVAVGILPVVLLSLAIARSRPGMERPAGG